MLFGLITYKSENIDSSKFYEFGYEINFFVNSVIIGSIEMMDFVQHLQQVYEVLLGE